MGIKGAAWLRETQDGVGKRAHIKDFAGCRVGIDISCWMHADAARCARLLVLGHPAGAWCLVQAVLRRLTDLRALGVTPVVVFDGAPLPAKQAVNEARHQARSRAADQLRRDDDAGRTSETNAWMRAVTITPELSRQLQLALRAAQIVFVQAPYEADAQLARLALTRYVAVVVSNDSDLLAYGCPRVLQAMGRDGWGVLITDAQLRAATHARTGQRLLSNWSHALFLDMCILAGCDYLPNLSQLGIATAHRLLNQHGDATTAIRVRPPAACNPTTATPTPPSCSASSDRSGRRSTRNCQRRRWRGTSTATGARERSSATNACTTPPAGRWCR
jgi:exonuclease-1